jgi:bifunctional non-homologous end joining protein LigD
VRPEVRIEVAYGERTTAGILRHPSFLGVREDLSVAPARREPAIRKAAQGRRLTNPDKVLYPEIGLTKGQLAAWVERMAPRLLPHVADRPLSLVRCPDGHGGPCFFQKHRGSAPAAVLPIDVPGQDQPYLQIRDVDGLVGLVQLGALEIHPWGSRSDALDRPDQLILDLDPDEGLPWTRVVGGARAARAILDELDLDSFVRWTGG